MVSVQGFSVEVLQDSSTGVLIAFCEEAGQVVARVGNPGDLLDAIVAGLPKSPTPTLPCWVNSRR